MPRRVLTAVGIVCLAAASMSNAGADSKDRARIGVGPFPVGGQSSQAAGALEVMTDLGKTLARTRAISWEELEPHLLPSPKGRFTWDALDSSVQLLQLAGFEPLVVLSCRSSWACQPVKETAWAKRCAAELSQAEATAALIDTDLSSRPPGHEHWKRWEVFVQRLVERYDADGKDDMPGLQRAIAGVQVQETPGELDDWLGSVGDYMRLLHHTDLGAHASHPLMQIVTGVVDVAGTGQNPHPNAREWKQRIKELLPTAPKSAVIAKERSFDLVQRLVDMPRLYDVIAQRGSGNIHDDFANIRFLRRALDAKGQHDHGVWLMDTGRKTGRSAIRGVQKASDDELRVRRRWIPPATNENHSEHERALSWLRTGQAYDIVRTFCTARLAGADAVVGYAPFDEVRGIRKRKTPGAQFMGLLASPKKAKDDKASPKKTVPERDLTRTTSWYALRQLQTRLEGHRSVAEANKGLPGRTVLFHFGVGAPQPFVAVVFRDPSRTWAGSPGRDGNPPKADVQFTAIPLPNGEYIVESMRLTSAKASARRVKVTDDLIELSLGPAPVYVYPVPIKRMKRK